MKEHKNNPVVEQKTDSLRFIVCGSVDDGKSTLLGRLLIDSGAVLDDQLADLRVESQKFGTQGDNVDVALLLDGLQAEREQGITIDIAYRFFEAEGRKFVAIDAPGHEQYTRNMATGASQADVAVILIDATRGVVTQTKRHSHIVNLMGIKEIVLIINKMDLVNYDEIKFDEIVSNYREFINEIGSLSFTAIPVSALTGCNVVSKSTPLSWYKGETLIGALINLSFEDKYSELLRLPVQWVNRPNPDFRGYSGTLVGGSLKVGDEVVVARSQEKTIIKKILGSNGFSETCKAGEAVTVCLGNELDISRGDMLVHPHDQPAIADQFAAHIIWFDQDPMHPGRQYIIKLATESGNVTISELSHVLDINSNKQLAGKKLEINEVGFCKLKVDRDIAFDPFANNQQTGSFILIDRYSNATVGAGVIKFALQRATNVKWHKMKVDQKARAAKLQQTPSLLWFTGLSGSGKSTIADLVERKLFANGLLTYIIDGDNVRHGLNNDLGFTESDRVENIRRIAELSRLMLDAGMVVIASFISPFKAERDFVRETVGHDSMVEIFVDTPLVVCEKRDPKGLYKKAREGNISNFTGIDSPYERPEDADLVLLTEKKNADTLADEVVRLFYSRFAYNVSK